MWFLDVRSVAAASVLARITRELEMGKLALLYPQYGFDKNLGNPNKEAMTALQTHGRSPAHRGAAMQMPQDRYGWADLTRRKY